jgi:hypothetical protein
MAYNPGNMAALALARHNAERDRALQAQMFNSKSAQAAAEAAKQRAEQEKQAAAVTKGFRQVWEASPELQQVIPVRNWGDVAPNQIMGMVQGLAMLQQREQQRIVQEKAMEEMRQQQAAQAQEHARAESMAALYGGQGGGQQFASGSGGSMAPGVYAVGRQGQMQVIEGGRKPFLPQGGGGGGGGAMGGNGGELTPHGPASQYVQGLLQRGVAPSQKELEEALKAQRVARTVGVDPANSFIQDPNGNLQRLQQPRDPSSTGPAMSPDGRFYDGTQAWKPVPGANAQERPLVRMNANDLERRLKSQARLNRELEELDNKKKLSRSEKADKTQKLDQLASIEQILAAGGYSPYEAPQSPQAPQPQAGGGVRQFATEEDAKRSGYKGFAMINGEPAYID